jgi:hypothetical protein
MNISCKKTPALLSVVASLFAYIWIMFQHSSIVAITSSYNCTKLRTNCERLERRENNNKSGKCLVGRTSAKSRAKTNKSAALLLFSTSAQ